MTVKNHGPREGFLCVGGPHHGQMMVKADGVRQFNVAILPDFDLFDPTGGPVAASIKTITYTLTRIADGNLIWQA